MRLDSNIESKSSKNTYLMCNWYQLVVSSTVPNGENSMLTTVLEKVGERWVVISNKTYPPCLVLEIGFSQSCFK